MKKTLLVDAGNSCLKWAGLDSKQLSKSHSLPYGNQTPIEKYSELIQLSSDEYSEVVLVSVHGDKYAGLARKLTEEENLKLHLITSLEQVGKLKNAYDKPNKLGADRFVAMLAAYKLADGNPCIVVDCGTAVTIDAIDSEANHLGGLILPGLNTCMNSLVKETSQLSLSKETPTATKLLAKNTQQAITGGSLYGLSGAIQFICSEIESDLLKKKTSLGGEKGIIKVICGGDSEVLLPQLPKDFQISPDLVMQGLRLITEQYLHYWDKEA